VGLLLGDGVGAFAANEGADDGSTDGDAVTSTLGSGVGSPAEYDGAKLGAREGIPIADALGCELGGLLLGKGVGELAR
jgi:hypothetical protein